MLLDNLLFFLRINLIIYNLQFKYTPIKVNNSDHNFILLSRLLEL
jgi:hypothetical protein